MKKTKKEPFKRKEILKYMNLLLRNKDKELELSNYEIAIIDYIIQYKKFVYPTRVSLVSDINMYIKQIFIVGKLIKSNSEKDEYIYKAKLSNNFDVTLEWKAYKNYKSYLMKKINNRIFYKKNLKITLNNLIDYKNDFMNASLEELFYIQEIVNKKLIKLKSDNTKENWNQKRKCFEAKIISGGFFIEYKIKIEDIMLTYKGHRYIESKFPKIISILSLTLATISTLATILAILIR
ncbi:hypothetical protein [Spiroplasma platyhelix]|uniref:Uncharacterized protein n=1 Tax=Spiroplasma platyhelix PALS-1 TaxID=1276218 RepID=A0A846U1Z2_9MOLU|nr:hypothetical protein [Spiroplasma platyhelix]MBE4704158.1 hypothetical protein [Spiroplasma platyhelix PALS-1]NKE38529.1 hypothetical protein [Spiroplasma platyhelix PALS-1]UJB29416.1 hypothetical protein SPLAT_v1c06520 [Spiroplasma platyhelix PALS-1]